MTYTPVNLMNQKITRSGVGTSFNLQLKSSTPLPTYILTEAFELLETESSEYLEVE